MVLLFGPGPRGACTASPALFAFRASGRSIYNTLDFAPACMIPARARGAAQKACGACVFDFYRTLCAKPGILIVKTLNVQDFCVCCVASGRQLVAGECQFARTLRKSSPSSDSVVAIFSCVDKIPSPGKKKIGRAGESPNLTRGEVASGLGGACAV